MEILFNRDCLEVLKNLPDNSIDLVVTDPPYRTISGGNKSTKWKSGYASSVLHKNDGKIFEYNDIKFNEWLPEVYRVLKEQTHFYVMTNVLNLKDLIQACEDVGFKLHNILVWEKNTANANRWYMKNCEFTLFLYKGNAKTINNPSSKMVHQFNNIVGTKQHPTEKPQELLKFYI
ncbi:MAG: site-specific DNA-methyltransferase, partial [Clostridia bacterium]|nr:site-specific DNA-methyltransferase [Clostridia bacterium]